MQNGYEVISVDNNSRSSAAILEAAQKDSGTSTNAPKEEIMFKEAANDDLTNPANLCRKKYPKLNQLARDLCDGQKMIPMLVLLPIQNIGTTCPGTCNIIVS